MGRFFNAVKAGVSAMKEASGPGAYVIADKPVRCPHCSNQKFTSGRALLNSAGSTFLNLDWTDPSATVLVCSECGRIEWFAQEPDRAGD